MPRISLLVGCMAALTLCSCEGPLTCGEGTEPNAAIAASWEEAPDINEGVVRIYAAVHK
jgi:hypothetical protein